MREGLHGLRPARGRRPLLPVWLHLTLSILAQLGGALGLTVVALLNMHRFEEAGIHVAIPFFGAFILGFLIPRLAFRFVIRAKCPECSGPATFHGGRPVTYECADCGYVHYTQVSEGES